MDFTNLQSVTPLASNAFGLSGILDKYGNILGIVLAVFGVIMLAFSGKAKQLGGFVLEMENHEPVIKDNGFELGKAKIGERRSTKIGDNTFGEMQLVFEHEGETYELWTPDLGMDGEVNIEYDPKNPAQFYITDKVAGAETVPDKDEDGEVIPDTKPTNNVFYAMLVFGIVLLGLGGGILYDFYVIK